VTGRSPICALATQTVVVPRLRTSLPWMTRTSPASRRLTSGSQKTNASKKTRGQPVKKTNCSKTKQASSIVQNAKVLSDSVVAHALSDLLPLSPEVVRIAMRRWKTPILKVGIPGSPGRVPSKVMLETAKHTVLRFLQKEEALGDDSCVVKAFYLASGEASLRFDWEGAQGRVHRARLDRRRSIDKWDECLAMTSGDTNSECEIYVCGTKPVTIRALTSLVCHEALHNLARRVRAGNCFLAEDTEHMAMALLGDPQLVQGEL